MANNRVHSVVITTRDGRRPIGVVSDLDVLAAVASRADSTAGVAAAIEPLAVAAGEPLETAAGLMHEHGVSHLVVVDVVEGYPLGVLSSLDIAAIYAGN
jgi:CBS domain-containing protein